MQGGPQVKDRICDDAGADGDGSVGGADAGPDIDAAPPDANGPPGCGDGEVGPTEACDIAIDACCNSTCTGPAGVNTVCRPFAGACDVPETCSGASVDCPVDKTVLPHLADKEYIARRMPMDSATPDSLEEGARALDHLLRIPTLVLQRNRAGHRGLR